MSEKIPVDVLEHFSKYAARALKTELEAKDSNEHNKPTMFHMPVAKQFASLNTPADLFALIVHLDLGQFVMINERPTSWQYNFADFLCKHGMISEKFADQLHAMNTWDQAQKIESEFQRLKSGIGEDLWGATDL